MATTHKRWILHADMDAFYASIEQRDNPEYREKPLIVGGIGSRGVVSTASYEARKYGVTSAMSIMEARRRCPHGIFIAPNIAKYALVSNEIRLILEDFSPIIEPLSLDEAFLDITGMEMLYPDIREIALKIKEQVQTKLNLTVSVGIAPNKFLAKLASDLRKPDGLVIIHPGEELKLLAPLSVKKLWGVGDGTAQILKTLNIKTIEEFRHTDFPTLKRHLGNNAIELYNLAWGRDERPVVPDREAKSIGNEDTFEQDIHAKDEISSKLLALSARVGWRLRKAGLSARTVTLKIRFSSFRTITRSITLTNPVSLDEMIYATALKMIEKVSISEGIRLLGISLSHMSQGETQLSLFEECSGKREKVTSVVDELKNRFGENIVKKGGVLK
jgi:DNA polymerase-4